MTEAPNVLISCLVNDRFPQEAELLFRSLRQFGGGLATSQCAAYFATSADPLTAEALADLDVAIKIVEPLSKDFPHANKVHLIDPDEAFDYIVALDTDVVVVRDFSIHIWGGAIAAKPVDADPLAMNDWRKLFEHFGLEFPVIRCRTTTTGTETLPYFNTGVIVVPHRHIRLLHDEWRTFISKIQAAYAELPEVARHSFYTDQFAFSLAVAKAKLPFRVLPVEMNFTTHAPVHALFEPEKSIPFIIHYHHRVSASGTLLPCTYSNVNALIQKFNERMIERGRTHMSWRSGGDLNEEPFDNLRFWEERYRNNLELGSGIGSRGIFLIYKRELINRVLEAYSPSSILDVGCGDLEVMKGIRFCGAYTGIDLSPFIIGRNRIAKPQWAFLEGDFLEILQRDHLRAEAVLCFGVLIHQHNYEKYRNFVRGLVEATRKVGLISGFETAPRKEFNGKVTAYHEPITRSLRECGVQSMEIIGSYRDTCVVLYKVCPREGEMIDRITGLVGRKRGEYAELEERQLANRVRDLEVEIRGLHNSISWRITAPLRWVGAPIVSLKRKLSSK